MKRKYQEVEKENQMFEEDNESILNILNNEVPSSKVRKVQKDEVKTFCRIKPVENDPGIFKPDEIDTKILHLNDGAEKSEKYNFTKVFGPLTDQGKVFEEISLPLIVDLLENRKSGLVFAYGVTNSGKTYTITGSPNDNGLLPLSLKHIWDKLSDDKHKGVQLSVNYVEIYNEQVLDLLSTDPPKKRVKVREREKTFYIENVTNRHITNISELSECLNMGVNKKVHTQTHLNPESSRSHTIFKVILKFPNEEEASISIVDLAGSEKSSRSGATGEELRETKKINTSLFTLSQCISIMRFNSSNIKQQTIPYRDSELTKLFMDYFQSGQNIVMIANINPVREDLSETLSVLQYACLAKDIKPTKCRIITNPNISNKKKIVKNDLNKNLTSDFSEYSDNDDFIYGPRKQLNNSIGNFQTNNFMGTPFKYQNYESEVETMRHKFEEMNKQKHEMEIKMIQLQHQVELSAMNTKMEMISMFSTLNTNINCSNTNRFIQAIESINPEVQTTYLPNPFYSSVKKDRRSLCLQPQFGISSFAVTLEQEKRKSVGLINIQPRIEEEKQIENEVVFPLTTNNINNEEVPVVDSINEKEKEESSPSNVEESITHIVPSENENNVEEDKPRTKKNKKKSKKASLKVQESVEVVTEEDYSRERETSYSEDEKLEKFEKLEKKTKNKKKYKKEDIISEEDENLNIEPVLEERKKKKKSKKQDSVISEEEAEEKSLQESLPEEGKIKKKKTKTKSKKQEEILEEEEVYSNAREVNPPSSNSEEEVIDVQKEIEKSKTFKEKQQKEKQVTSQFKYN